MAQQQQSKPTTYQRLSKLFGTGGQPEVQKQPSISAKELLTATSAEELMLKRLEAQQAQYLGNQFEKLTSNLYQQTVYYETTRLASYGDLEAMEYTPEISASLDLISEESCLAGNTNIKLLDGSNLTIEELYTKNKKNFWVYSYDINNDKFIPVKAEKVIYKGIKDVYLIKLDDDTEIKCTDNHKWLGKDNKWIETSELYKGYSFNNHRVISIKYVGKEKVYDIVNSGKFNNFGVKCNNGMIISHNCTLNEFGKMLQVFSDSKRVKTVLENLFNNTLDININLPAWTRNTCKFGDNFLYLKSEIGKGIVSVKQLPNIEIRREESSITDQKNVVRFIWQGKSMEFTVYQIAHFRLLGDDRHLPYGTSFLEKARKIWKMLVLAEDAMLTYRIMRAPERRVHYIDVGNMDDKDVEAHIQRVAQKLGKRTTQAENTGNFTSQVDVRFNTLSVDQDYFLPTRAGGGQTKIETLPGATNLCISLDTKIPLLDGRILELSEIIKEYKENKENWVYSCNPKTGEIVPGIISWAGITRKNAQVLKIILDNGKEIISTPDHKFLTRDGIKKEAKDLEINESLMPFRKKLKPIRKSMSKYEMIWDNSKQKWIYTHRIMANNLKDTDQYNEMIYDKKYINENKNTIHHKDINRFNNNPSNLYFMNNKDHYTYHSETFGNNFAKIGGLALSEKIKNDKEFAIQCSKSTSIKSKDFWSNLSNEEYNNQCNKISIGIKNYLNTLSSEQIIDRTLKNINHPTVKLITTKKLIEWSKNPDNLKWKGELISKSKSTPEHKKLCSENAKKLWKNEKFRNKVFNKPQKIIFTDRLYSIFFDTFKRNGRADLTLIELNKNEEFMNEFISTNSGIRSSLTNLLKFTHNHVDKMIKEKGYKNYRDWIKITSDNLGYKNVRAWRYYIGKANGFGPYYEKANKEKEVIECYNHKITNIEWLEEKIDTGTITVDGEHKYHNFHTFAVDSGIFVFNSEIQDIEYIQRKLFTAMRIPKAFLGFEEAIGEGKNLALQDIRFARTINRIQQSMIQELNKIAIIHLYMLGFEEELDNFSLSLNSPSTQAEMLKIEQWKEKILLYRDMVSDAGNGFAATSMTWAKRNILNFSDDEINLDLNQQRIEKAAGKENEAPEQIIHTGLFDNLDKRYQKKEGEELPEASPEEGAPGEIPGLGGGPEMGGPGGEELPPIAAAGGPEGGAEAIPELKEEKLQLLESKYKILDDNSKVLHEDIKSILEEIDNVLKSGEEISIKKIIDNNEDLKD